MDKLDERIIAALAKDADVTATELSAGLHLSVPAINKRIRALKQEGVIQKYTVITDHKRVGKPIIAFVLIVLKSIEETDRFFAHVSEDPDFLECHAITGEYDCMLKVCVASVEELDRKLAVLKTHNGVMKSYTMLSLTTHKYSPTVLPSTP